MAAGSVIRIYNIPPCTLPLRSIFHNPILVNFALLMNQSGQGGDMFGLLENLYILSANTIPPAT